MQSQRTPIVVRSGPPVRHNPPQPRPQRPYPPPSYSSYANFVYGDSVTGHTRYWVWGDLASGKTPLICIHGGPGFPHNYLRPISLIYRDFGINVVMYDQIGCGQSTRFPHKVGDASFWTVDLFKAELKNLIRELRVDKFHLLGHSWGGMLAAQYAIDEKPNGLHKLVLSNIPPDMRSWMTSLRVLRSAMPLWMQELMNRCERERRFADRQYHNAIRYFYLRHFCRLHPPPQVLQDACAGLADPGTVHHTMMGPSEFYPRGCLRDWSIRGRLAEIDRRTCPGGVLVIHGKYDIVNEDMMDCLWEGIQVETHWITFDYSSHLPMLEETESYVDQLGYFLINV